MISKKVVNSGFAFIKRLAEPSVYYTRFRCEWNIDASYVDPRFLTYYNRQRDGADR